MEMLIGYLADQLAPADKLIAALLRETASQKTHQRAPLQVSSAFKRGATMKRSTTIAATIYVGAAIYCGCIQADC